eukprot:13429923-Alexandrium_andersonii.AAC.1
MLDIAYLAADANALTSLLPQQLTSKIESQSFNQLHCGRVGSLGDQLVCQTCGPRHEIPGVSNLID